MLLADNSGLAQDSRAAGSWYALYTRHQHENTVAQILTNKGYEVFLPLYSVAHRWQDRTKQLRLPLFPCYVFLRGTFGGWLHVLTTPGVHTIVGWGGRPAVIPEVEIEAVRQVVNSSLRFEPHPFLKCGDRVRIKSGPLRGLEGILVRKKNLFRLVITVEMLGKSAAVEIDTCSLERLSSPFAMAQQVSSSAHSLRQ